MLTETFDLEQIEKRRANFWAPSLRSQIESCEPYVAQVVASELNDLDFLIREVKKYRGALEKIARCPNGDSVEDCHDLMSDIAHDALGHNRHVH